MFQHELHIPKERVAVIIGKRGATRRRIEKATETKLTVDREGNVLISSDDNLNVFITSSIVKAIGRGFNPDIAMTLLSEDRYLEIIPIKSIIGDSANKLQRVKARLIGSEGKAWKTIEQLTNTDVSVYGKTAAIIGRPDDVLVAKQAIEKLIHGSKHGNVYKYIEKQKTRVR